MRWVTRQISRPFDRLGHAAVRQESMLIRNPRSMVRLLIISGVLFAVVIAGSFSRRFLSGVAFWVDWFVLVLFAGFGIWYWLGRAVSYRSGWVEGHLQAVVSLSETLERGLSLEDWVTAEAERVAQVMGVSADALLPLDREE